MIRALKYDMKAIMNTRELKYCLMILAFIALLNTLYIFFGSEYLDYYFLKDANYGFVFANDLKNSECVIYIFIIPLVIPLVFYRWLQYDIKMMPYIMIRNDEKYYFFSKVICLFLIGMALWFFYFSLYYLFYYCLLGINENIVSWINIFNIYDFERIRTGILTDLYINHIFLYNCVYVLLYSLYAGICAVLFFTLCLFIENKYVCLLTPFTFFILLPHILAYVFGETLYNISVLNSLIPFSSSNSIYMIFIVFLVIILFLIVSIYIKRKGYDKK